MILNIPISHALYGPAFFQLIILYNKKLGSMSKTHGQEKIPTGLQYMDCHQPVSVTFHEIWFLPPNHTKYLQNEGIFIKVIGYFFCTRHCLMRSRCWNQKKLNVLLCTWHPWKYLCKEKRRSLLWFCLCFRLHLTKNLITSESSCYHMSGGRVGEDDLYVVLWHQLLLCL